MSDFKWNKKEQYSDEDVTKLIAEHRNKVYAQAKDEISKEFEPKLKEYETKINQFEEDKLFSSVNNDKQKNIIKSLMNNDEYKSLTKEEAFNKINEEYKDVFGWNKPKEEEIKQPYHDITNTIMGLHTNSTTPYMFDELDKKAKTTGIKDPKEMEKYIISQKAEALKK